MPERLQADPYHQAVVSAFDAGERSLMIEAAPGTGKTATVLTCLSHLNLDRTRVLLTSFGRQVRDDLSRRVPDHPHMRVSTIHSLGRAALEHAIGPTVVDAHKYRTLISQALHLKRRAERSAALHDRLEILLEKVMLTLTDPADPDALYRLAVQHALDTQDWEQTWPLVALILSAGAQDATRGARRLSFTDMVYLPVRFNLPIPGYDLLVTEEAQDVSCAQRILLSRVATNGQRTLMTADPRQAVFSFIGADPDAYTHLVSATGARILPLRRCYRCPRRHIALANAVYDVLEPAPRAREGTVAHIDLAEALRVLAPGDLVLCRTNGPLFDLAYRLLGRERRVRLWGQDLARPLQSLITQALCTVTDADAPISQALSAYALSLQERLEQEPQQAPMASVHLWDRVHALRVICARAEPRTVDDLRQEVTRLCTPRPGTAIDLATVHRAKGLESKRVFLLRPDLLPHPRAHTPQQQDEERNILFVALTRARHDLFFIDTLPGEEAEDAP